MDMKTVRDLTRLMRENDLTELEVESPDFKVRLAKARPTETVMVSASAAPAPAAVSLAPAPAQPATEDYSAYKQIISPIPGTIYLRANPESKPFVTLGGPVEDGAVVCLVEAMKVFNEIKSEGVSGTIKKICVEDGQAVEYGTVLFMVG